MSSKRKCDEKTEKDGETEKDEETRKEAKVDPIEETKKDPNEEMKVDQVEETKKDPNEEMKVDQVEETKVVEETKKDLSDPANNWLIRKYQAACEREAKAVMQQIINDASVEELYAEMRKGFSSIRVDIIVDRKGRCESIGPLKVFSDGCVLIKNVVSSARKWHPFNELAGYQFVLADADSDTGMKLTPGFENVPVQPPKGKNKAETIRNFDEWMVRVEEHNNLSTESAAFKFDQIPTAKLREVPALLKGLYEYMDNHPESFFEERGFREGKNIPI
jgi:hypothetical protein